MTASINFAELSWPEVRDLQGGPQVVVLLLPVGVVEPHGPHAPLDVDSIISLGTCARAARALAQDPNLRALVLPPISYGITDYASSFSGAIGVRDETLGALVVDVCSAAMKAGFPRIVIVNNHFEPEQVATLRRAVAGLNNGGSAKVAYLDLTRRANAERLGNEFRDGSCHAGRYETSLVLAERPELIDTAKMAGLPPLHVNMPEAIAEGRTDFLAMGMADAYCGSPSEATPEEGHERFVTLSQMLVDLVRDLARD
ncbi:MAG: creatininase family protein [Actinobacteria bacterium]|nr:creatininase family protein [Actinomycetota bacterium]